MRQVEMALVAVFFLFAASGCNGRGKEQKAQEPSTPSKVSDRPDKTRPGPSARRKPGPPRKLYEAKIWDSVDEVNTGCGNHITEAEGIIKKILTVKGERTAGNTLALFNRLLIQVDRIQHRSELIANVHPSKPVRTAAEKCEQNAKKFASRFKLNRNLYDALKAVNPKGLDPRAKRFRRLLMREYRRAGVHLDKPTRKKLAAMHEEMVKVGQKFARNIREGKRFMKVAEKDLEGLPADFIAARKKGKKPGAKIRISTDYPDFFAVETYAKKEAVRRKLYKLFLSRAYPVNARILKRLLTLRHTYATTLGFPDWAEYMAEDKMVKKKKVIADFIKKVSRLTRPRMVSDLKEILARKKKDNPRAAFVASWDRFYYVKKIQAERFGVNPVEVRAHFAFKNVKAGLLAVSQEFFGVTFKRVKGAKTWHPSVETYDVYDRGERVARFYLDLHPRKGKYGHAAEFPMLSGVSGVQLPTASLVTNFPDPSKTGGKPALTEHHQVTTFFHEFGHLMHQLLAGRHRWVTQSGIACEWDFVEAPSQLMEEWAWDANVLRRFAKHHKTGKPIPAALVRRMRKAKEFGKGVHVMRQMFYAGLSLGYHDRDPAKLNLMAVMKQIQKKYNPYPYQKGTAVFANFGHLHGYSSMYYTYMWSLVLAKDFFTRFKAKGLMDRATAMAYRKAVLEPGGSVDALDMVKNFLGRPHSFEAFRKYLQGK